MAVFAESGLSERLETATSGSQRGQRINYGMFSVKFCGTAPGRVAPRNRVARLPLVFVPRARPPRGFLRTIIARRPQIVAYGAKPARRQRLLRLLLPSADFLREEAAGVIDAQGSNGELFVGNIGALAAG